MKRISTVVASALAVASFAATAGAATGVSALPLGPLTTSAAQPTYVGYYDGHKDSYVVTDTSNKAQARAMKINYSAGLAAVKGVPRQFFIEGRAAAGQIAVFGSEPGESDYNPLWEEIIVTWKPGAAPVLLVRDDQIDSLAKAGKLIERDAHVVLNAPILKVGK